MVETGTRGGATDEPGEPGFEARATEDVEEMGREAEDVGRELREAAEQRAGRWTEQVGRQAFSLAHALDVAGRDLEAQGQKRFADWSDTAADEVKKMAGYLENNDPQGIVRDVHGLARQNPAAFVGGTFAAGLLLGRFLRTSDPDRQRTSQEG